MLSPSKTDNHGSPLSFPLWSVNCHGFLDKLVKWFPVIIKDWSLNVFFFKSYPRYEIIFDLIINILHLHDGDKDI